MNYIVSQKLYCLAPQINQLVVSYGGYFVNSCSCPTDGVIVIRVNPAFVGNIITEIQNMGFVLGDVSTSGIQSYIYIRGFMY